jgi:riboflavin kinase/FMN adenylyltransferase
MKVIFGLRNLKKYRKPVVALGVFDGVHRGHIKILKSVVKKAAAIRGTSVVLTFSPHPQRQESLYSLEHRLRLISDLGMDVAIVINFDKKFASSSAADFIKNILSKKIGVHSIYVGRNFRFGKNAEGDCRMLEKFSKIYNYKLKVFRVVKVNNRPISSTSIRALIKKGDFLCVEKFLGRPVSVLGTVIKGSSLGRRLGFSTANIDAHHEVIPAKGVYAVNCVLGARQFKGICYIGTKPTLKTPLAPGIEVHIFGLKKNIYARSLEVRFIKKIREERKFPSLSALSAQIKKDTIVAKRLLYT